MRKQKKALSIAIDAGNHVFKSTVKSGIERLVEETVRELSKKNDVHIDYYYFGNEKIPHTDPSLNFHKLPKKGFSQIFLPLAALKNRNTVFLGFSGHIPQMLRFFPIKKILFLHDFAFFQNPTLFQNPTSLQKQTNRSIKAASSIVVFSNYVKKQLLDFDRSIPYHKVIKLYPGADHLLHMIKEDMPLQCNYPYFLYVGVIKPMKQIRGLIQIFRMYIDKSKDDQTHLILIGKKEQNYFKQVILEKDYIHLQDRIHFIDSVDDKKLVWYYMHARSFLNYSVDEGFCYPVLEALSLNCKCIVNNISLYEEFSMFGSKLNIAQNKEEFIDYMTTKIEDTVALQFVNNCFTWEDFADKLHSLCTSQ